MTNNVTDKATLESKKYETAFSYSVISHMSLTRFTQVGELLLIV